MSNLIWLGIAVFLSIVGWTVLWLRNRRPSSTEASLREFSKELQALAPPPDPRGQPPTGSRSPRSRRSG